MVEYGKSVEVPVQKPLYQKTLGYILAVFGGFIGGPLGLIASPLVLLACNISGEKVLKDKNGKEVRYPVNLTFEEKEIARKIQRAFK